MNRSTRRARAATSRNPRWLNAKELKAWRSLTLLIALLPTALEEQLQRDSQLSYIEYYALAGLSDAPGRTMRLTELAVLTNAELSRLSHLITRLERRGFVRREPDPNDGRCTNAVLTAAGYKHLVAAAPGHVVTVRDLVIDALDGNELEAIQKIADRIITRVDDPVASSTAAWPRQRTAQVKEPKS